MPSRRDKRAAEKVKFEREFTATFGRTPPPTTERVPEGVDPRVARKETERLAATHDPLQPSACRICSIVVPPGGEVMDGWKCCDRCVELVAAGRAAVYSDLLGVDITAAEVDDVAGRMSLPNPTYMFAGHWPTDAGSTERWAHISLVVVSNGRGVLDEIRARSLPRRNSAGKGCMACGTATSTRWTRAPWRWSPDRRAVHGSLCADCLPWVQRSGAYSGHDFHAHLLAAATGMRRPSMDFTLGIRAYYESDPPDPSGTDERWEYLAPVMARLRMKVLKARPHQLDPTEREARILAQEAMVAEATETRVRAPLADVS